MLDWGVQPIGPPHLGWVRGGSSGSLPPVQCWELRVLRELRPWHRGIRITLAASGCGLGLVLLSHFTHGLTVRFSERSVHPSDAGPRFGSGNCPCLVAESVFNLTLPSLKTNLHLNFPGLGKPELAQIWTQAVCLLPKEQGQL